MSQLVFVLVILIAISSILLFLLVSKNNEIYLLKKELNQSKVCLDYCESYHHDQETLSVITLIFCNEENLKYIEQQVGMNRKVAVDLWIENSAWGDDLPMFIGHKGTDEDRLLALRNAITSSK